MNISEKTNLKHKDSEAIWGIFASAKSEFEELIAKSLELQRELNELRHKAHAKAKLVQALQDALKAQAEDVVPKSVLQKPNLSVGEERVTAAHSIVIRFLQSTKSEIVEAAQLIRSPEALNIGIEPKAIYNVLNYLAQKGELRKVGRGRYAVRSSGVGVETSAELGNFEELDRD
jgi:Tfp pilus assembly protein FimV